MELDVLTLGEAMVLFAADEAGTLAQVERFRRFVAGAELNVAIGLSRLGLRAGYLSRLGKDAFGRVVLDTLAAEGITPTLVAMDEQHPTGFMLKSLELDGRDPQIEYHRRVRPRAAWAWPIFNGCRACAPATCTSRASARRCRRLAANSRSRPSGGPGARA